MKRHAWPLWWFLVGSFQVALASAPVTGGVGAVLVERGSGTDPVTLATMRTLTLQQLRQQGLRMVDGAALEGVQPVDASTGEKLRALGASRLFVLEVGRLGRKVILGLEERELDGQQVLTTASLQSDDVEEVDRVLPRLVNAVLHRESAEQNAQIATVTSEEARDFNKKPGERFWALGLPFGIVSGRTGGALGFSLAYMYEGENFRVDFTGMLVGNSGSSSTSGGGAGLLGIGGSYLFLPGEVTPYVGGGIGFMGISRGESSGGGAGVTAEAGVEFLRLRRIRIIVGLEALLPAYRNGDGTYTPFALLHTRIAF